MYSIRLYWNVLCISWHVFLREQLRVANVFFILTSHELILSCWHSKDEISILLQRMVWYRMLWRKIRPWYNASALHKAASAVRVFFGSNAARQRSPQAHKILIITPSASSWYEVPHRSSSLTISLYAKPLRAFKGQPPRQCVSYGCLHCYYCATKWHQMSEVILRVAVFALISEVSIARGHDNVRPDIHNNTSRNETKNS